MTYTSVYRFFDDRDVLLYVGMTNSLSHRLAQHEAKKSWWRAVSSVTIEHYNTREQAAIAEREAIRAELPYWNIEYQPDVPLLVRVGKLRSVLGEIIDEVMALAQRQRELQDPEWCFYEAWYYGGLHQRAKFALYGDDINESSGDRSMTLDEFVNSFPQTEVHEHEKRLHESWASVAEAMMAMLPPCGSACDHYEHDDEHHYDYDYDEENF